MRKRTAQRFFDLSAISKKQATLAVLDRNLKRRVKTLIRHKLVVDNERLVLTDIGSRLLSSYRLANITLSCLPQGEYIADKLCSGKRYYVGRRA